MSWRTHAILGANVAWLAAAVGGIDQYAIYWPVVGALAGLLPDVDASSAKIQYMGGGILGMLRGVFEHRGFFHSILIVLLIFVFCFLFLAQVHPLLPLVLTLGYASHPLIDGLNRPGVKFLWPLKYKIRFVPRNLSPRVDGLVDQGIFFVGVLTLALFVLTVYYPFIKSSQVISSI